MIKRGFKLNPYDRCVVNNTIDKRRCTSLWHVDDLKISHVDSNILDDIIELLGEEYGQDTETPLMLHHEKMHDYLGMTII